VTEADAEPPTTRRTRAAPMTPDVRRHAIIDATLPLLRRYGHRATTRQIAEAAGVAEGTIFRVFSDKDALVQAAVTAALDPTDVEQQLDAIDLGLALEERIAAAAAIMQKRMRSVFDLMMVLGLDRPPVPRGHSGHHTGRSAHDGVMTRFTRLFEPDRARIRCTPEEAARLLRVVVFAGSHDLINDGRPLSPDEICALLLDGIRAPANRNVPPEPSTTGEPLC
jgi:AcrR family transcriptional regulator